MKSDVLHRHRSTGIILVLVWLFGTTLGGTALAIVLGYVLGARPAPAPAPAL